LKTTELQHADAEAIALLVVESKDEPREALEVYARVLGVPTIRDGEIRPPEDLDKSLVERVGADKYVGADWTEPPKGLLVETRDNRLAVTLPPRHAKWLIVAPLLIFIVAVIVAATSGGSVLVVTLMGFAAMVPFWVFAWLDTQKKRQLEITRDAVIFMPGTVSAPEENTVLPLNSIEEVSVSRLRGLSIAGDQGIII